MQELEPILRIHADRYPKMEPTDAVKLIYQNEFGGGHMIPSPEKALSYLRREYDATLHDPTQPLREEIGNGMVRINLAALQPEELELLGQAFLQSAVAHRGELGRFLEKLALLRALTGEGVFGFSTEELERYLVEYAKNNYPMVSHSEAYRTAYHPAYRIIKE